MNTVLRTMLINSLRDKITLFYSIIFPIVLLIGLGYYFNDEIYLPRLLVGVIALSSLFWGVSGVAFQVFGQRSRGVYKLLKMTPYSITQFILVVTIARTLLGILINICVLLVGMALFSIHISFSGIWLMIGAMLLGILCFTCLGFLISNLSSNEGQINMISNLFFFPMIFGADTFYSVKNAPDWVNTMGDLFPFSYYLDILRHSSGLGELNHSAFFSGSILIIFTVIFILLAVFTFKWELQGERRLKKHHKHVI